MDNFLQKQGRKKSGKHRNHKRIIQEIQKSKDNKGIEIKKENY